MGDITMDEVHSLFLTSGSSSSRFSLDTDSSALDSGLLPSEAAKGLDEVCGNS